LDHADTVAFDDFFRLLGIVRTCNRGHPSASPFGIVPERSFNWEAAGMSTAPKRPLSAGRFEESPFAPGPQRVRHRNRATSRALPDCARPASGRAAPGAREIPRI